MPRIAIAVFTAASTATPILASGIHGAMTLIIASCTATSAGFAAWLSSAHPKKWRRS